MHLTSGVNMNILDYDVFECFFQNMCRQLYCPPFSVPVNGQCVPYIYGEICYILVVNLIPLDRIPLESIKTDLKTSLFVIKKQFGFGNCESLHENIFLKRGSDNIELSELQVKFFLTPSGHCNMLYMWSKIVSIQTSQTNIRIMLAGNMTNFQGVWTNLPQQPGEFQLLYSSIKRFFCLSLNLQLGSTCPKIKLTQEEYKLVVQGHTAADKLLIAPVEEGSNDTMFVCCDKYVTRALATGIKTKESLMNIQMALFSVIFTYWS